MTKVAMNGAAGRMGCRLIALGHQDSELELVGAIESAESSVIGNDAGVQAGIGNIDLPFASKIEAECDVVIDFSSPEGAVSAVEMCREKKIALVMASTGLSDSTIADLKSLSEEVPVVWAPNMSLAVNLTMKLTQIAGEALKNHSSGVDVEIIERHHRYKEDSPSGTALKFGEIVADAMGKSKHVHGREGFCGARSNDEIGYHAVRTGDNPGEHTIIFGLLGETIELRVGATNRDCYALGALAAAKWVAGQSSGIYSMQDVLGI